MPAPVTTTTRPAASTSSRPALAKGLEFDHVVLVEPADDRRTPRPTSLTGLRRLYVCLTRAVTSLVIVAHRPVPEALDSPEGS